jgi:16S rRNA (guanine966-N2)-methyltransferase
VSRRAASPSPSPARRGERVAAGRGAPAAPASGPGSAGRVIGGRARGIRLATPGEGTRPLADRVKQTLFAILERGLPGARVLDLFAGSGAAGIEALSRGASSSVFVESDRAAVGTIHANLERTRLAGATAVVVRAEVIGWLGTPAVQGAGPFDLVFVDPPYDHPQLLVASLERLGSGDLVAPGGQVVAKHFWRDRPPDQAGLLASKRERRFGETALTFYRLAPEDAPHPVEEDA